MKQKRVVITGIGVISPLGIGLYENWDAMINAKSGIKSISSFDASTFPIKVGGEIRDFSINDFIVKKKNIKAMNKESKLAVAASKLVLNDAKIFENKFNPNEMGLYFGVGLITGMLEDLCQPIFSSLDEMKNVSYDKYLSYGYYDMDPLWCFKTLPNMPLAYISMNFNIKGPNVAFSSFSGDSAQAIGEAYRAIQEGKVKYSLSGGSGCNLNPFAIGTFNTFDVLSKTGSVKSSMPFDKNRDGIVPGDGAVAIILENLDSALQRNVKIYGEIVGYGYSNKGCNWFNEDVDSQGLIIAMQNALRDANVQASEVDYINASGDSSIVGDKLENAAIKDVFRDNVNNISISATKSMTGELAAASAPMGIIASLLGIEKNIIHPTINFENFDPECDLNYVPNKAIGKNVNIAMINAFSMSGVNASIIIKKFS